MTVKWVMPALLPFVFVTAAAATFNPALSIAAIALCTLAVVVLARFGPRQLVHPTVGAQPDWIVVLLPTVLAIRPFSTRASLLITGLLLAAAFTRRREDRFRVEPGPLLLLIASAAIVYSRPAAVGPLLTFLVVGVLIVRLIMTVDARRIIASLIDGCGLYLLANVLCYAAGLQSPASNVRFGGLVESSGFVRTIYPLTWSINIPPVIAAMYVAAIIFLIPESGWLRRSLRLTCLIAAIIVIINSGTRAPMVVAAVLSITVICFPFITRWLAQATTIFAVISALVLPSIITSVQSLVAPLLSFAPGRISDVESVTSLEGRSYIWDKSIKFWIDSVNDLPHMLFGFGVNGHYRSGASLTYTDQVTSIVKDPELVGHMHNSFLQQLFDGGLIGWLLLVLATYWASTRLANRRSDWGSLGLSAIVALAALLLSGNDGGVTDTRRESGNLLAASGICWSCLSSAG